MTQSEILIDITMAKLINENCQSVSDIAKALNKTYTQDDIIGFNKFMFSVKMQAMATGKHTDFVLADLFAKMLTQN